MTNFEEAQNIKAQRQQATPINEEARRKADADKREAAIDFLKTRRIFKDLLENRTDLMKECKDYLLLNVLVPQIGLNDFVNADFANGYRNALESFEAIYNKYVEYEKQYNTTGGVN